MTLLIMFQPGDSTENGYKLFGNVFRHFVSTKRNINKNTTRKHFSYIANCIVELPFRVK